jgi:phage-related protein
VTTFTYTPDFPATETTTLSLHTSAYGNYEQRLAPDIYTLIDTWSIKFSGRTATDRDAILSFLSSSAGLTPFTWTTPFGETGQFLCAEWDTTLDSCALSTVSATFASTYTPDGPNIAGPPAPTGAFTHIPNFGASQKYATGAKSFAFGDGYKQPSAFGLHPEQIEWPLTFSERTNVERTAIREFLRGARGQTAFAWTPPYGTTAKYVCTTWKTDYMGYNNNTTNATLRRVFET